MTQYGPSIQQSQWPALRKEGKVMATFDNGKALVIETKGENLVQFSIEEVGPDSQPITFTMDEEQTLKIIEQLAKVIQYKRKVAAELRDHVLGQLHSTAEANFGRQR